jgi:hypothetical protein
MKVTVANSWAVRTFNLTATAANCSSKEAGYLTCSESMQIPSGKRTITITLFSEENAKGKQLSTATTQVNIAATGFTPIPVTLDGVVARATVLIDGKAVVEVPVGTPTSLPVTVSAYDATGNLIIAPGSYTTPVVVTSSDTTGVTAFGKKLRRTPVKRYAVQRFNFTAPGATQPLSYDGASLVSVTLKPSVNGTPEPATDGATLTGSGSSITEYPLSSIPGGVSSVAAGINGDTNVYYVTGARAANGANAQCAIGYVSTTTGKLFENDTFFGFEGSPSIQPTCENGEPTVADNGLFSNGYTQIVPGPASAVSASKTTWSYLTYSIGFPLQATVDLSDIQGSMAGRNYLNSVSTIGGAPYHQVPDPYLGSQGWWWYTFNDYPSATALGINTFGYAHNGMISAFQYFDSATQYNAGPASGSPSNSKGPPPDYGGTTYDPIDIVAGTDNNLYFTDCGGFLHGGSGEIDAIGQIVSGPTEGAGNWGAVIEVKVPRQGSCPFGLTVAPDGSLWFTENPAGVTPGAINSYYGHLVINKSNFAESKITEYPLVAGADAYPTAITATQDGSLWIAANNYGIIRISNLNAATPSQQLIAPAHTAEVIRDITVGPDANIWYANYNYSAAGGSSVGRLIYGAPPTPGPAKNHA